MTWKQKLCAWLLISGYYLFTFLTPIVAAYFLLAEDVASAEGKGGFLFYLLVVVFGGGLLIALGKLLGKQKANFFKSIFRGVMHLVAGYGVIVVCTYVDFNIMRLLDVFYIMLGGFFIGTIFELFAVGIYRDYMREVGVF